MAPSETTKTRYAGFWLRLAALAIDAFLLWIADWLASLAVVGALYWVGLSHVMSDNPVAFQTLLWIGCVGLSLPYGVLFLTLRGATPGKRALGLRVVSCADYGRPRPGQALARQLGFLASWFFPATFFLIAIDREKRSIYDHLAGTVVIRDSVGYNLGK